jgi:aminoglycoside phosphotransferase (APT) family kinase protein
LEFSSSSVEPVLQAACERAGIPSDGAELVRLGENAIFLLREPELIVRIARSADRLRRVQKELCIARWLTRAGVPSVRPDEAAEQPQVIHGHPVSFWYAVDGVGPAPGQRDLAVLLRRFHGAEDCPCDLPEFDPLGPVQGRLNNARGVSDGDLAFLAERCLRLRASLGRLDYALPPGPIHGDAHTANLLADRGQVVLLDFESSAIGPREWDLMPTAIAVDRFGLADGAYQAFAQSYGFDVRAWPGYRVLREVRELTMTTWLMQNVSENDRTAREFDVRVACLREGDFSRGWNFF